VIGASCSGRAFCLCKETARLHTGFNFTWRSMPIPKTSKGSDQIDSAVNLAVVRYRCNHKNGASAFPAVTWVFFERCFLCDLPAMRAPVRAG
jgi:hypothetical protein